MASSAYQVLADCPTCRIEAAVVELVLADRVATDGEIGTTLEARCRYCGYARALGTPVAEGVVPRDASAVRAALERWAREEGDDVAAFVDANFCGLGSAQVEALLLAGERVPTSFDVLGYLFPGAGVPALPAVGRVAEPDAARREATGRLLASSNIAARAMAALILADGEIRAGERRFLDEFLRRAGHEPLAERDLRPWRPTDLDVPDEPEPIVEAMVHLVYADRQSDETEWRVVREFARHWGVPLRHLETMRQALDREHAGIARRLFFLLRSLFVEG